jgi:hypothetical protein
VLIQTNYKNDYALNNTPFDYEDIIQRRLIAIKYFPGLVATFFYRFKTVVFERRWVNAIEFTIVGFSLSFIELYYSEYGKRF